MEIHGDPRDIHGNPREMNEESVGNLWEIHGYQWKSLEIDRKQWGIMSTYGDPLKYIEIHGNPIEIFGNPLEIQEKSMDIHGKAMDIHLEVHGHPLESHRKSMGNPLEIHGDPRKSMEIHR